MRTTTAQSSFQHSFFHRSRSPSRRFTIQIPRLRSRLFAQSSLMAEKLRILEKHTQDLHESHLRTDEQLQRMTDTCNMLQHRVDTLEQQLTMVEEYVQDQHVHRHKRTRLPSIPESCTHTDASTNTSTSDQSDRQSWYTVKL